MKPRDIQPGVCGRDALGDNFIERHGRRIDNAGSGGTKIENRLRHERTRVETNRAARDQITSPNRNQVRSSWSGADEMDGHSLSPMAMAQDASLLDTRGASRRALRPAAARAAVSAIDGTPFRSSTSCERVSAPGAARTKSCSASGINGRERRAAASRRPGSSLLPAAVASATQLRTLQSAFRKRLLDALLYGGGGCAAAASYSSDDHGFTARHCVTGIAGRQP